LSAATGRRSSLGCLGLLSAVLLLVFTAAEVGIVSYLDPQWLDRVAFWRPAPFEREPLPVEDEAERAALLAAFLQELQESQAPPAPQSTEPELFPFLQVTQSYDPARGARLQTPWDTTVEFPPGAIDSACDVTLTPVRALPGHMAVEVAGPAVDLRVGEHEHYDFRRPVRMTLPFDPEVDSDPRIAVWERDHWMPLPTVVDRRADTVSANVPHASLFVVKGLTVGVAVLYGVYQAVPAKWLSWLNIGKSAGWAGLYLGADTYETQAFRIYYYTSGAHQVPADSAYPIRTGQAVGEAPLYVKDLAAWFEEARLGFKTLGLPIRPWTMRKHDVFLSAQTAYGESPLGGPLFISSRNMQYDVNRIGREELQRGTVAHELLHVSQDRFFSRGGAATYRWWIECSAAYLGDTYWQLKGGDNPHVVRDVYCAKVGGQLLLTPIDEAEDPECYAWASLLEWLDRRYGAAGFKVFADLTASGSARISELDASLQKHTERNLPEIIAEFARDFHYGDLWSGEILPSIHRGGRIVVQGFGERTIETPFKEILVKSSKHLTADVFYARADHLPESRRAKLVMSVTQLGGFDPGLWFYLAADAAGSSLPIPGQPAGLQEQVVSGYKKVWVLDDFSTEGGTDMVTLLIVNAATSRTAPGYEVSRWLLEPPQNVDFRRKSDTEPNTWVVTWDDVGLSKEIIFDGFRVYRRVFGEPEEAAVLLTERPEKTKWKLEDTAPGLGSYVYTVTVVDTEANESKHSRIVVNDPFEGRWKGRIFLVEGSLTDILKPLIDHYMGGEGSAKLQAIRERIETLAKGADVVARAGIPVELDLMKYASGRYFMRVTRAFGKEIEDAKSIELKKRGEQTLVTEIPEAPDQPPLVLRLTQANEMKDRKFSFPVIVDGTPKDFALRWNLTRHAPE